MIGFLNSSRNVMARGSHVYFISETGDVCIFDIGSLDETVVEKGRDAQDFYLFSDASMCVLSSKGEVFLRNPFKHSTIPRSTTEGEAHWTNITKLTHKYIVTCWYPSKEYNSVILLSHGLEHLDTKHVSSKTAVNSCLRGVLPVVSKGVTYLLLPYVHTFIHIVSYIYDVIHVVGVKNVSYGSMSRVI